MLFCFKKGKKKGYCFFLIFQNWIFFLKNFFFEGLKMILKSQNIFFTSTFLPNCFDFSFILLNFSLIYWFCISTFLFLLFLFSIEYFFFFLFYFIGFFFLSSQESIFYLFGIEFKRGGKKKVRRRRKRRRSKRKLFLLEKDKKKVRNTRQGKKRKELKKKGKGNRKTKGGNKKITQNSFL